MTTILWALAALLLCAVGAAGCAVGASLFGPRVAPRPTVMHLDDGGRHAACGAAEALVTDDPGRVSCRDCGHHVAALRAAAGDATLRPEWWGPRDTGHDIAQVSTRDMSHDTTSPYPTATDYRAGLIGHTITVEVLDEDAARRWASPPDDIDRVAVIERMDGRFGTVRHVVQGGAADPDELAEVSALSLGARYVPAAVAR